MHIGSRGQGEARVPVEVILVVALLGFAGLGVWFLIRALSGRHR